MQQFDRRRALLGGCKHSEWDIEYYASRGVLPSETYFTTTLRNENCSAVMNNGFLRLTGQAPSNTGQGAFIFIKNNYFSNKSELEVAFYIRQFAAGMSLRTGVCGLSALGRGIIAETKTDRTTAYVGSFVQRSITTPNSLDTRYVLRLSQDSLANTGQIYRNDALLYEYSGNLNTLYNSTYVAAVSGGYNAASIVDVEYIKYRNL